MRLIINKAYNEYFVKKFLIKYIHDRILNVYDPSKALKLNTEFKINSQKILEAVANNLVVNETPTYYKICVNKNIKLNNVSIIQLLNLITYGNRSCKGYTLVLDIFNFVKENLDVLYKEWLDGD